MPSLVEQMTPDELQFCAALLLRKVELLEKGDPQAVKFLQGAKQLLDRARDSQSRDASALPPSPNSSPTT
jgi:hypothetical protein